MVVGGAVVGDAAVVVDAVVVVGATVVVDVAVVVDAVVVVGATVVVGIAVVIGAVVVDGVAVSVFPPQADATNRNASATAYFLIDPVCHPSPEGGGGDIGAPRCRYAQAKISL